MLEFFKKIFCKHDYQKYKNYNVETFWSDYDNLPYKEEHITIFICKKCGKVKKRVIRLY